MTRPGITEIFAALSQETRLEAIRLLLRYPDFALTAGDIARLLAVPHNTLSTHLSVLQAADLVQSRRDGRRALFRLRSEGLDVAAQFFSEHRPLRNENATAANINEHIYNVLVLCTGNSARSIMAEAILNREAAGRMRCFSAGNDPAGSVNPQALALLSSLGYDTSALRSKHWSEYEAADAPVMDIVITVCDRAAGEACPAWLGHPYSAHWGIADPVGSCDRQRAFREAYRLLMHRMTSLVNVRIASLDPSELRRELSRIGSMTGATDLALSDAVA